MFCPRCGKRSRGICVNCFLEENPIKLKKIEIPLCSCGAYYYRGQWNTDLKGFLMDIIKRNLILPSEICLDNIKVIPKIEKGNISARIHLSGEYKGEKFIKEIETNIKTEAVKCKKCSRLSSCYYEAILQFRGISDPKSLVDQEFISGIKRVQGGTNIYITSSKYARQIGSKLNRRGFFVKESAKLMGRRGGRDLYRIYISIKSPEFEVGDFLGYKKKIVQILEIGKIVMCRDILNRKKLALPLPVLKNARIIARKSDVRKAIVSAVRPDEIQVLDLETGNTYEIPGIFENLKQGKDIGILRLGRGEIYIV